MLNRLLKHKKSNTKGFTIIEVMIVLAIAGLILLIVFLAVPALQRSSRNTQRKTDVGRIGSAVQTVLANNNGNITVLTNTPANNTTLQKELGTLSYYLTTNVTLAGAATAAVTNGTTVDTVNVYTDATCAAMTGGLGATSTNATAKGIAVVYSTESGSAAAPACIAQ